MILQEIAAELEKLSYDDLKAIIAAGKVIPLRYKTQTCYDVLVAIAESILKHKPEPDRECPSCRGAGEILRMRCVNCNGRGWI